MFKNVATLLNLAKSSFKSIIKVTLYLTEMKDFKAVDNEYVKWFPESSLPPRTVISVRALPAGALVEIDILAV